MTSGTSVPTDSPVETPRPLHQDCISTADGLKMSSADEMESSFRDLVRDPEDLVAAGFRPVWSAGDGYPGPLPADIAEWIDPELGASARFIGPMSSLFWLAGLDDLVAAIDNPDYTMCDEIINIPSNATIPLMVNLLWEYGKVPSVLFNLQFDLPQVPIVARPVRHEIPSTVTGALLSHDLRSLFPKCRQQHLPPRIQSTRISWNSRLARDIERDFTRGLGGNLLFRALSREAVFQSMIFFAPVIASTNTDNEFGPGIYTTTSLEHSLRYASTQGALMVFQNPDFRNLRVSELTGDDWTLITNYFQGHPTSNLRERVPSTFLEADVVKGVISKPGGRRGPARVPGTDTQVVAVSYGGCGALAASLKMIIWFE